MINYPGGVAWHECVAKIEAAGISMVYDGGIAQFDVAAAQAIVDSFTLDEARAPIIARIKELARQKIVAFLPEWKQSNINARMNELNEVRFSRELTPEEHAEVELMRSIWTKAKRIRETSNLHESNLLSLTAFEAVAAYDYTVNWEV